jgi:hypothetical protein
VDHDDVLVRQADPGIERGQAAIAPPGDPAQEDLREGGAVEPERRLPNGGQIVGRHHRAEHGRDVLYVALDRGHLLIGHRSISCAEVYGAFDELPNPAARPD